MAGRCVRGQNMSVCVFWGGGGVGDELGECVTCGYECSKRKRQFEYSSLGD